MPTSRSQVVNTALLKTAALAAGLMVLGAGYSADASAQMLCGDRETIASKLAQEYGEMPNGMGLTHTGGMLEIFKSPKGTWTITLTMPDTDENGALQACLVAHGNNWETIPPQLASAKPGDLS